MTSWITSGAAVLAGNIFSEAKKSKKTNAFINQRVSVTQLSAIKGGNEGDGEDILIVDIIGG